MKKQIMLAGVFMLLFWACQQPSKVAVLSSGPEIDNLKKNMDAYLAADWTTYRSAFADTATIIFNSMHFDPDSLVRYQQARRNYYDKVEMETDAMEYVRYENGDEYTHFWGRLSFTVKGTGRVVVLPIHMANQIMGGKSVAQYAYFNTAEITAAIQESMAPPVK